MTFLPAGNSNYTAMTSRMSKRQADDIEEVEDPNDPCWKFTVGYPREMEFYSPLYPENYPSKIDCLKTIEGKGIAENICKFPNRAVK